MRLTAGPTRGLSARLALVLLTCLGLAGWPSPAAAQAPWTWAGYFENVSTAGGPPSSPIAADGVSGTSRHPVSQEGRYIVFDSAASNLGGPPAPSTIYRRDRTTGQLSIIQSGYVRNAAISPDGMHIAFEACQPGFSACQVYARDLRTSTTTLISATVPGAFGNGDSWNPVLSANGRFVAFVTNAQNLSNDALRRKQIVLRDRDTDADGIYDEPGAVGMQTVSAITGVPGNGDSDTPEISENGSVVAFRSAASNLVGGDTNGLVDVFMKSAGTIRRLNLRPGNVQSPFPIAEPHLSISGNGQYVAFASADPALAPGADGNSALDVFIYQGTSNLLRIDVGRSGSTPVFGDGPTGWATLNYDGRYLSLQSSATNAPFLSSTGTVQVYAVDRQLQTVTRISGMPDGTEPDAPSTQPSITSGGSLVVFSSSATTFTGMAAPASPQIHAAARLNVTPTTITLPAEGGEAVVTIAAHYYTRLQPWVDPEGSWITTSLALNPPDFNQLTLSAPPNDGGERSTVVHVGTRTVTVTQDSGVPLSISSVSPNAGVPAGGDRVTVTGSGFTPGSTVYFGWYPAYTEFVDATTLVAYSPGGLAYTQVAVEVYDSQSNRWASLPDGFHYLDVTPPTVVPVVTGPLGRNGWYVGDVRIDWVVTDPESPVTATTCAPIDVTTDVITWYWCTATSEGGTGGNYVDIMRDATPPTVRIDAPFDGQVVERGAVLTTYNWCENTGASYYAPFECTSTAPYGTALPTATPGWYNVTVTAVDDAGNRASGKVDYGVWDDTCQAPPAGMRAWLRFENNLLDATSWPLEPDTWDTPMYVSGRSGIGVRYAGPLDLWYWADWRLDFTSAMSVAFWFKPDGWPFPGVGALISQRDKYRIERLADGRVSWTILGQNGAAVASGTSTAPIPADEWAHIAFTFDAGTAALYVNGRLAQTSTVPLSQFVSGTGPLVTIAGTESQGGADGVYDEVQLYERALDAATIGRLFLARAAGVCAPVKAALYVPSVTVPVGTHWYEAKARLLDMSARPVAGKTVEITVTMENNVWSTNTLQTDEDGWVVWWNAPLRNLPAGTYPTLIQAVFRGDASHMATSNQGALTIQLIAPSIGWAPAPLTYGTPLGAAQLNATSLPGTFVYTPAAGTILPAGSRTLSTTFTPQDPNYATVTKTATLVVLKAVPGLTVTGGTFLYDGQAHAATAAATDYQGAALSPVTVTYNGLTAAPSASGVYAVVATFAGDANHESRSATSTLTIDPFTPVVTVAGGTFTYDGQPHAAAVTVTGAGADVPPGVVTITYDGSTTVPVNAGTYAVSASVAAAGNYRAASATGTLTILKAAVTVSLQANSVTFDGQPHPAIATATGANGASLSPVTITYDGSSAVPVNGGAYAVAASFDGDANHLPASATATLLITKAVPVLAWSPPAPITYGTPLSAAQLNATSSAAGTFTYEPPAGSVLVAGVVHPLTATFTPAEPRNYEGGTVSTTIAVERAPASVTVTGGAFTYDGQPHEAVASATGVGGAPLSPVTVTYNGSAAVPVGAGSYDVVATFTGDANHAPGSATTTITIGKAAAGLSWSAPAPVVYGTPLSAAQLNATAAVAGTFVYTPAAGTVLGGGPAHPLSATFTPADPANYEGGTVSTTIAVQQAAASVTVTGGAFTFDGQPHEASASATGVGGTPLTPVTVTYNGASAAPMAAGSYEVTATYAGDANHAPASATATITIGKAAAALSWSAPAAIGYGAPLGAAQLNATASVPGTFAYAPAAATVLSAGTHTLTATFTPADPANHTGGTVSTTLTVVPAALTVRTNDAAKAYGAPLPGFTASFTGLVGGDTPASLGGALVFATAATSSSAVGTYPVTPAGLASPNYAISFAAGTLTVAKAPVAMTLAASPTPSGLDMPITFTATVAAAQSAPTAPAGIVRFFDGATLLGTATLSNGTAAILTGGLTAGSHTIEARYDGDASFDVGSRTASHVVNTAAATPAITITSSRQPANTSQSVTFTAAITVATSGTIGFYDGNTLLGTASIAAGAATLTTSPLAAGSHAITARFQGNASAPPVISPVFVQSVTSNGWKDRTSTVSLVSSANPSALGSSVTFTATASGSSGTPAGRILFMVDGLIVGDPAGVAVSGSGQASVSIATLNGGRHKVTATYLGSSNYRGSNGAVTQTVN